MEWVFCPGREWRRRPLRSTIHRLGATGSGQERHILGERDRLTKPSDRGEFRCASANPPRCLTDVLDAWLHWAHPRAMWPKSCLQTHAYGKLIIAECSSMEKKSILSHLTMPAPMDDFAELIVQEKHNRQKREDLKQMPIKKRRRK